MCFDSIKNNYDNANASIIKISKVKILYDQNTALFTFHCFIMLISVHMQIWILTEIIQVITLHTCTCSCFFFSVKVYAFPFSDLLINYNKSYTCISFSTLGFIPWKIKYWNNFNSESTKNKPIISQAISVITYIHAHITYKESCSNW